MEKRIIKQEKISGRTFFCSIQTMVRRSGIIKAIPTCHTAFFITQYSPYQHAKKAFARCKTAFSTKPHDV